MGKIAIIGGGAAGVSALYQLVDIILDKKTACNIQSIVVIERSKQIGPGLAYSETGSDEYILNLPYPKMSPVPKQPDHFSKWLKNAENLHKWRTFFPELDIDKTEFLPRKLFGLYLADLAMTLQKNAQMNGIEVEFIYDEVINLLSSKEGGLAIILKTNNILIADSAVLCIGHLPSSQPPQYEQFKSKKGYYETPWEVNQEDMLIEKDLLILGTRLSAIDAALARSAYIKEQTQNGYNGPVGKIISVSRTGLPPRILSNITEDYVRNELTLEAIDRETAYGTKAIPLKTLKRMFKAEIKRAYKTIKDQEVKVSLKAIIQYMPDPVSWLEREIQSAKEGKKRPWQTVLFSLYPVVPRLWEALDEEGKKEFLDKYYTFWMTYLAAFPIENAEKILALLKSEQLTMLGGLDSLAYNQENEEFEVVLRNGNRLSSAYVINATGQGHDVTQADSTLLKNLLASGVIKAYPLGGIEVNFKSLQAIGEYRNLPLFIVGDPTWGACMATADLYQIANNQIPRAINSMLRLYNYKQQECFSLGGQQHYSFLAPPKKSNLPQGYQSEPLATFK